MIDFVFFGWNFALFWKNRRSWAKWIKFNLVFLDLAKFNNLRSIQVYQIWIHLSFIILTQSKFGHLNSTFLHNYQISKSWQNPPNYSFQISISIPFIMLTCSTLRLLDLKIKMEPFHFSFFPLFDLFSTLKIEISIN